MQSTQFLHHRRQATLGQPITFARPAFVGGHGLHCKLQRFPPLLGRSAIIARVAAVEQPETEEDPVRSTSLLHSHSACGGTGLSGATAKAS
jgi:hypothetical protein